MFCFFFLAGKSYDPGNTTDEIAQREKKKKEIYEKIISASLSRELQTTTV
jgi:hypothetical protein